MTSGHSFACVVCTLPCFSPQKRLDKPRDNGRNMLGPHLKLVATQSLYHGNFCVHILRPSPSLRSSAVLSTLRKYFGASAWCTHIRKWWSYFVGWQGWPSLNIEIPWTFQANAVWQAHWFCQ